MLNFNNPSYPDYFLRYSHSSLGNSYQSDSIYLKLYMLFYKHAILEWSVPDSWGGDYTFNVYKTEHRNGEYRKINPTPIPSSTNSFKDITTTDVSKFRSSFYILEVRFENGNTIKSKSITLENIRNDWVQLRAREVTRRESLLLTKFTGIESLVFRKKTFGNRCPICWNREVEKVMRDNCTSCLGTSFEGGYFSGFKTLLQYETTPNPSVLGSQGTVEPSSISAWTLNYPEIDTFDVIFRIPDWKLYRVDAVQTTELQTVKVRQILTLTELSKNCIEYELAKQAIPKELL